MKELCRGFLMLLAFTLCVRTLASETTSEQFLPMGGGESDALGLTRLIEPQRRALERAFPNSKILVVCKGNYSGNSPNELILTVTSASHTANRGPVSRVGLIFSDNEWRIHSIDGEIKMDSAISHASHLDEWNNPADPEKLANSVKCNAVLKTDKDLSNNGKLLGRAPFFNPAKIGKRSGTNACFSSSAEYNNWDCVAYDPRQRRFRLWYQQVFAD
jgi:hypothetical protein